MFKNIQYRSSSTGKDNIDVCNVNDTCAWVLDGADALFPTHVSNLDSDGDWFIKQLNSYLKRHLAQTTDSIEDVLYEGLKQVHKAFLNFPNTKDLYDLQMPNASCAVVRVKEESISYFVLGNSEIIITYHTGETRSICDLRLQGMDAKLLEISQNARKKQRIPLYKARDFMDHMLVENRLRRNDEQGYYVLSEDESVVSHAMQGELPLNDIKSIALICNGFSQYFNCKRVGQNLEEYIHQTRNKELVELYHSMLMKHAYSESLARYMQTKLSGQSMMVYFDVENTNQLTMKE